MNATNRKAMPIILLVLSGCIATYDNAAEFSCERGYEQTNSTSEGFVEYRCFVSDDSGQVAQDGEYRVTDEAGNILLRGYFRNGVPSGTWSNYNSSGSLVEESIYADGELIRQKSWDENGAEIEPHYP